MQIGSVSASDTQQLRDAQLARAAQGTISPVTQQTAQAQSVTPSGKDQDGDTDGSVSAAPDSTSDTGKQLNVVA